MKKQILLSKLALIKDLFIEYEFSCNQIESGINCGFVKQEDLLKFNNIICDIYECGLEFISVLNDLYWKDNLKTHSFECV